MHSLAFALASVMSLALSACATTAAPTATGFSAQETGSIRALMEQSVEARKIGSAVVLIAQDGQPVLQEAYGEIEPGVPMPADAIVRTSSITKTVMAVAVLRLHEEGRLRVDQSVADFFPEFASLRVTKEATDAGPATEALSRPITIADLLTHQAGFQSDGDEAWALYEAPTTTELTTRLARMPLNAQPGTSFEYGPSYEVLAALVEKISGERLDHHLQRRVFTPLRMDDTSFFVPEAKRQRLAGVWQRNESGVLFLQRQRGQEEAPNDFLSGGGGLRSTVQDYFRFAQMLLNGGELEGVRLLRPETVALMTTSHTGERYGLEGFGWGYGARVKTGLGDSHGGGTGSFGWAGGTGTAFLVDPGTRLVAIIVAPSNPGPIMRDVDALKRQFLMSAHQAAASGE